ncbi:uncharacterized protein LOC113518232 isoform X2 [Galleria mellonella]|nr:uncharacterized protein LOC113518232 isoform X2 [Galleria mellonella]
MRNENEESLKIIEIHSEPNLTHRNDHSVISASCIKSKSQSSLSPDTVWSNKNEDDTFILAEKLVSNLCLSPKNDKTVQLNNTLEVVDYILKNGPSCMSKNNEELLEGNQLKDRLASKITIVTPKKDQILLDSTDKEECVETIVTGSHITPKKVESKSDNKTELHITTFSGQKIKTPGIFKTPVSRNPVSHKKALLSSVKKIPSRTKSFDHIASPVASYIKNCPVVPILTEVHPTKPLPGPSSIPKLVKGKVPNKPCNKENVNANLPSIAYKNAKQTKVMAAPNADKLPQCQWIKKITSSLPKPSVIKHDHREINPAKRLLLLRQEDSFGDLSLKQADVSVCTQKSAFNRHK